MKVIKKILNFPLVRQSTTYTCSCACVQACLCYYGFDYREGQIQKMMGIRSSKEIHPKKIINLLHKFKLCAPYEKLTLNGVISNIERNTPVIINLQAWYKTENPDYSKDDDGHYVVAIGFDDLQRRIIFADPASYYKVYLPYDEFEKRWHDGDKGDSDYDHVGIPVWSSEGRKPVYSSRRIIKMG